MLERRKDGRMAIKGGAWAGFVGGLAMSVLMLVMNLSAGLDVWAGMKVPALPLLGERVLRPGFEAGPVVLGVLIHFAIAIAWGVAFGLVAHGLSRRATVGFGLLWGIAVWLAMFYVVLPLAGADAISRGSPVGLALFQHLVYGLFTGIGFAPYQPPRAGLGQRVDERPVQRPTRGGRDLEGPPAHP